MDRYALTFARSARKELQTIHPGTADRVLAAIEQLALDPRPAGCRKLRDSRDLWRIRVSDYRVVYRIDDSEKLVDVLIVRHRSDVYR